jgi:hypothetical protein
MHNLLRLEGKQAPLFYSISAKALSDLSPVRIFVVFDNSGLLLKSSVFGGQFSNAEDIWICCLLRLSTHAAAHYNHVCIQLFAVCKIIEGRNLSVVDIRNLLLNIQRLVQ